MLIIILIILLYFIGIPSGLLTMSNVAWTTSKLRLSRTRKKVPPRKAEGFVIVPYVERQNGNSYSHIQETWYCHSCSPIP